MKKWTESTAAKIVAVLLSFVCLVTLVLSVGSIVVLGYYKFYFSDEKTVRTEILRDMAAREASYIEVCLDDDGKNLREYYKDKNVYYEITDYYSGEILDTNYEGQEVLASASSVYHIWTEYKNVDLKGNFEIVSDFVPSANITVYVAAEMTHNDLFSVASKLVELGFKLQWTVIVLALVSLALFAFLISFLFCAVGHKDGSVRTGPFDRIPFDLYTAVAGAVVIFGVWTVIDWGVRSLLWIAWSLFVISVSYFIILLWLLSLAVRIKTSTLIKNNLIYKVMRFVFSLLSKGARGLAFVISRLTLITKTLLLIAGLVICEVITLIFLALMRYHFYFAELTVFLLVMVNLIFIGLIIYFALVLREIQRGGEKIAGGDLEHKINTSYMFGDFKRFAQSLNNINVGLKTAVDRQMKSEKFKTELITNVSHDIKTPLTSIINYVDLIKKEDVENPNVRQYLEVLDRQSARLKKLVEDLTEASKASSGVLKVELLPCDPQVLLTQAMGEFEDRFKKASVRPVLKTVNQPIFILADGRHLWRVFDNLMGNICKYAAPDTRAYFDITADDTRVYITLRNISKYELNISAEELMERFVRGDSSRNTEGSGLGISIAKSLTELQKGRFELAVDGDLFKVILTFNRET